MASFFIIGDQKRYVMIRRSAFDALVLWLRTSVSNGSVDDKLFESRFGATDLGVFDLTNVKESTECKLIELLEEIINPGHPFWTSLIEHREYAVGFQERFKNGHNQEEAISIFTQPYREAIGPLIDALKQAVDSRRRWRSSLPARVRLLVMLKILERDLFVAQATAAGINIVNIERVYQWARSIGYKKKPPFLSR